LERNDARSSFLRSVKRELEYPKILGRSLVIDSPKLSRRGTRYWTSGTILRTLKPPFHQLIYAFVTCLLAQALRLVIEESLSRNLITERLVLHNLPIENPLTLPDNREDLRRACGRSGELKEKEDTPCD
jgi:hypothetical protein